MKWLPLFLLTICLVPATARADISMPAIISDHAMLQADKPIAIWGWAEPGARITVGFVPQGASGMARTFTATTDDAGKWTGRLAPLPAGATGQLVVTSDRDAPRTVNDVIVGEVWLGGGQSNMVYDIAGTRGGDPKDPVEVAQIARNVAIARQEAAAAPEPIRYFEVARVGSEEPADDVDGRWVQADARNVPTFSAVAWNFAVALQGRLHVPIGLVISCVGGSHIEVWLPVATIRETSVGREVMRRYDALRTDMIVKVKAQHEAEMKAWYAGHPAAELPVTTVTMTFPFASAATFRSLPARLYNGMIHGLEPYTLRGILWYQADGDIKTPAEYGELFQALIRKWRADWNEPLPFYFVEMNNMVEDRQTRPVQPHNLCLIREAQHAGLQEPGVGMVAAIDVGIKNAHFPDKKPVGERLARLALGECYHQPMGEVNGPLYRGFQVEGSRVRLTFAAAGGLRVRGGGQLKGFAIRGPSGDWVWATGRIEGGDIVVWSDSIPSPVAVRYAWAANPVISVENAAGLPLYPFRTDIESKE